MKTKWLIIKKWHSMYALKCVLLMPKNTIFTVLKKKVKREKFGVMDTFEASPIWTDLGQISHLMINIYSKDDNAYIRNII
jgi:hypothetical protein